MTKLFKDRNLQAYKHKGFWKCMDTLRDKIDLEKILNDKGPIWKK
jgi:glucose-1-phosphate cytidylyltransferase